MIDDTHFACCFCGETIQTTRADPGRLSYAPGLHAADAGTSQDLYCHADCLKTRLHPSVALYALDLLKDRDQ